MSEADKATAERNMEPLNVSMRPHMADWRDRLNAMIRSREPVRTRLRRLYAVVDEMTAHAALYSPCKRGCSACCYMAVAVTEPEAKMLGAAISREPKKPKQWAFRKGLNDLAFVGKENPCPFLRNGECSIYENRPFACRAHMSMGASADACDMSELRETATLNLAPLNMAYGLICATTHVADLRAYFP